MSNTTRKPRQAYNPGFLDEENLEALKMSVDGELWDISTNFKQTDEILGDVFEKTENLEIDRDKMNAKIEEYWHLSVENDKALAEHITNIQADIEGENGYLSSQIKETKQAITTLEQTMATTTTELSSSISSVKDSAQAELDAAQKALEEAIANGDTEAAEKLKAEIDRLQGIIDANKADIEAKLKVTNQTVADLDSAMALNKTELEASISTTTSSVADKAKADLIAAQEALDQAIKDGDTAEANRLKAEIDRLLGIIDSNKTDIESKLSITNQTIAELDKTMASNKTELESKISTAEGNANSQAQKDLAAAKKALEEAIAAGDDEAAKKLQAEIDKLMGIINSNKSEIESKLNITNQTIAELDKTMASNKTELESKITISEGNATSQAQKDLAAAKKALEEAIASGDDEAAKKLKAEVDRLTGVINSATTELNSKIDITNETLTTLTDTVATHRRELESSITASGGAAVAEANRLAKEALTKAEADLKLAILAGDDDAIKRLTAVIEQLKKDVNSDLVNIRSSIKTVETTANNAQQAAAKVDTTLTTEYGPWKSSISQQMSSTIDSLGRINDKWGIEINNSTGKISGVSLNSGNGRSNFEVRADIFSFTNHHNKGIVSNGSTTTFSGIIYADGGVFNGTVNANGGDFNNVTIRENCHVLGTLYADKIVGLPAGKHFSIGETGQLYPSENYTQLFATTIPSSSGRFGYVGLLGGRPEIKITGEGGLEIEVRLDGRLVHHTSSGGSTSWGSVGGLVGLPFDCGSAGGTVSIWVRVPPNARGNAWFRMGSGYLYTAINNPAFWP